MKSWNQIKLYSYLKENYSEGYYKNVIQTVDSMEKRLLICKYHKNEFHAAYNMYLPSSADQEEAFFAGLDYSESGKAKTNEMFLACTAHAIAYVQSLHAVIDIVSHIIYYAHGGKKGDTFKSTNLVTMKNLKTELDESKKLPELLITIKNMLGTSEYVRLEDLSNTVKHIILPITIYKSKQENLPDTPHGLVFSSFEKGSKSYPEKSISVFFEDTFDPIRLQIVNILNELNFSLGLQQ